MKRKKQKGVTVPRKIISGKVADDIYSERKQKNYYARLRRKALGMKSRLETAGIHPDAVFNSVKGYVENEEDTRGQRQLATPSSNPLRAEKNRLRREEGLRVPTSKVFPNNA